MCGIVGAITETAVSQELYDALILIQHRGQDAAGIMTCDDNHINLRKGLGLVREVIRPKHMIKLLGNMGIGHVRYPTAGSENADQAQPLYVNSPYGLGIVHNGNLINADVLRKELIHTDLRHLNTDSDTEVMLNVFAHELQQQGKLPLTPTQVFDAVRAIHKRCVGSYAAIVMIADQGMVAFRDPFGIRPLVMGQHKTNSNNILFASESVALDVLNYQLLGDVAPGEAVFVDLKGNVTREQCADNPQHYPCIFEAVYLARQDSIIDGLSVHAFRQFLGAQLAQRIADTVDVSDIDVVIPIPSTSRTIALPLAEKLKLPYREGFVKNRYVGRTFIMPGQALRKKSVRQKLNAINNEFKDKNILLVDDSIVRGTTSKEIIQLAREAGAKKVYFASAAPPIKFPNVYGIDMPSREELIAYNRDIDEICQQIGADHLIYQTIDGLFAAAKQTNPELTHFDDSIFTGQYITGSVDEAYFKWLAERRSDQSKQRRRQQSDTLAVQSS